MTTVLLIVIYVVFIGLGIPDSTLGSAWPAMYPDLNLPVSYASFITIVISVCTTLASFFSARIINKFGTRVVAAVSTFLTAGALLGFSLSNSIYILCLCAVPTGLGAGAIDAALNNYVAVHYKASHLNFLHCFYGIGVALSPLLLSFTLRGGDWRQGYRIVFYIQIAIALLSLASFPLWNKVKRDTPKTDDFTPVTLTYKQMFKNPAVRVGWIAYFMTCALEFTCDNWICTYLVSAEKVSESTAALFLTVYFTGMALGRFLSGVISSKVKGTTIISIGYSLVAIAIVIQFLPIPYYIKGSAFFLIGLGNGPTFPNLTLINPKTFGKEVSQSLVSSQAAASNLGILVMPSVFGVLAERLSLKAFPFFIAGLYVVLVIYTVLYFNRIKKVNKDDLIFNQKGENI